MRVRVRVSVLMPAFNSERTLRAAVESVLTQSFRDFELVVVDDGSTDATKRIAESFGDRRIRIISSGRNEGISASRNKAVAAAEGEYLAWLDSDDVAKPNRLGTQASFLDAHPSVGFCHSNFEEIDADGKVVREKWNGPAFLPTEWQMIWTNPVAQSTVMFRKSLLNGNAAPYNAEYDPAEDYDLWTRMMLDTRVGYLPDVLVSYRTTPTSAFHTWATRALRRSVESNGRLVSSLTGAPVPGFHKFLTTFEGALDDAMPRVDLGTLREWYHLVASIVAERAAWDGPTRDRVESDVQERLASLLREKRQVLFTRQTVRLLWKEAPLVLLRLVGRALYRSARRVARGLLKPRVAAGAG
jgi:glycosyltransferase involved in cell wall biosynthesis